LRSGSRRTRQSSSRNGSRSTPPDRLTSLVKELQSVSSDLAKEKATLHKAIANRASSSVLPPTIDQMVLTLDLATLRSSTPRRERTEPR